MANMNFNTGPYYDDFDPANNFYKVLFKPGYAVQARELNQLQSILQNQVTSVGKHLFKKNSMVIPGGIVLNTTADIISVSGIDDVSGLVGQTITNATNFDYTLGLSSSDFANYITAVVIAVKAATDTAPAALYVKYLKTGQYGGLFTLNETLSTVGPTLTTFKVHSSIAPTIGKVATINKGTFYTRDMFVDVPTQTIIIETDSSTVTNCTVGLNIVEKIITSDDDDTLLDNSTGTPNEYAPGADRYAVFLPIARIDNTTTINDDNFIKLMTIENDVVTYLNNKTEYAELMKTLARRTYDANGNFIVKGLQTTITDAPGEDYVWANIAKGKCYLGGYEYEQIADTRIPVGKARGTDFEKVMPTVAKYTANMPFMYVAGGTHAEELPAPDSLVQFTNATPDGTDTIIGYGFFKHIQYMFGTVGTNDVYKMFFEGIFLDKGYSLSDIGGVKVPTANQGVSVLHELRLSNINGTFVGGNTLTSGLGGSETGLIFAAVDNVIYVIKNTANGIPSSDAVNSSAGGTATRRVTFVSNYDASFIPMYEVSKDTYKTLSNVAYSIVRRDTVVVNGANTYAFPGTTLGANEEFVDFSSNDYYAYVVETGEFVALVNTVNFEITNSGKSWNLIVSSSSPMKPPSGTYNVYIYSTVSKTSVSKSAKNITSGETLIAAPSNSYMALGHQDVQSIEKVVEGRIVNVTSATWSATGGDANKAVLTITYKHLNGKPFNHNQNDTIVVKGVGTGYDGTFQIASAVAVPGTPGDTETEVTLTIKYSVLSSPAAGTSVTPSDGTVALAPSFANDPVITSRYRFESGNTAYMTGTGLIKKKDGSTSPIGQIGVKYNYYEVGTGDFISVDSYKQTGDTTLNYIGDIRNVKDILGSTVEMRRYIDFRIRPSSYFFKNAGDVVTTSNTLNLRDLNLSAHASTLVNKRIIGPGYEDGAIIESVTQVSGNTVLTLVDGAGDPLNPTSNVSNGTYYVGLKGAELSLADTDAGAKTFSFPRDGSKFSYTYTAFLPRQVLVYVDRQEDTLKVKYMDVKSLAEAAKFQRGEFKLPLIHLRLEPYTLDITEVTPFRFENPVYTMLDIHSLKYKIDRNEYYSSLALNRDVVGEVSVANQSATTSLYGFWNEDFMDMANQEYNSDDFKCTVYDGAYASPGVVTRTVPLRVTNEDDTTHTITRSTATLPYTEARAFGNNKASRVNNLNPYNLTQWFGKVSLTPSVDNWVDTNTTVVKTTVKKVTNNYTPIPAPDLKDQNAGIQPIVPTLPAVKLPAPHVEEVITKAWEEEDGNTKKVHYETSHGARGNFTLSTKPADDKGVTSEVRQNVKDKVEQFEANHLVNRKMTDPLVRNAVLGVLVYHPQHLS